MTIGPLASALLKTALLLFCVLLPCRPLPAYGQATPPFHVELAPDTATVNSLGRWAVRFVVVATPLPAGATLKVRFVKGFGNVLQYEHPNRRGYVATQSSTPRATLRIADITETDADVPWKWSRGVFVVTAVVEQGPALPGDTLSVLFGAATSGGAVNAPRSAFTDDVYVAYDLEGDGRFVEVQPRPQFQVRPAPPYRLVAFLPSDAVVAEPTRLTVVAMDAFYNQATAFHGPVTVTASDPAATVPPALTFTPEDAGRKAVTVTFRTPGVHTLALHATGRQPDSLWHAATNPVRVAAQAPPLRTYWGDLHSHSAISYDGYGQGGFAKARDVAALDFFANSDHSSNPWDQPGTLAAEWAAIKQTVAAFHEPGRFVTFPAYEFGALSPSGHHNIYFNAPDDRMAAVPLYYRHILEQAQQLWTLAARLPDGIDLIGVPHHSAVVWDKTLATGPWVSFGEAFSRPAYRPALEIYSGHGLAEAYEPDHPLSYGAIDPGRTTIDGPHYAQDAWASGEVLGVIASTDDHSARPGMPYKGLAAVLATSLTRDAIFEAIRQRRTYATVGARILLDFRVNGHLMGAQLATAPEALPEIEVAVHGTDALATVEVLRWDGAYAGGHPVFTSIHPATPNAPQYRTQFTDSTFSGAAIYYVRVRQRKGVYDDLRDTYRPVWAWSSPIWINEVVPPPPVPTGGLDVRPNYPNPFRTHSLLTYYVEQDGPIAISLYDVLGRRVRRLFNGFRTAGWHELLIGSQGLPAGTYFTHFTAGPHHAVQPIVVAH